MSEPSSEAYRRAVEAVRAARRAGRPESALQALRQPGRELSAALSNDPLTLLLFTSRSTPSYYGYAHAVNVALLSCQVAAGLGWDADERASLAACALAHDLLRPGSPGESAQDEDARLHPAGMEGLFGHIAEIERALPESATLAFKRRQAAETPDPTGRRQSVGQGSHLLALCDIYESITHHRSWRKPRLAHDAIVQGLQIHRRASDEKLMRSFTEVLTLYPPGSYVRLSNGELARVVKVNPSSPSRPTVAIVARADGKAEDPPLLIDLTSAAASTHVESAVDETSVAVADAALALSLESQRWWLL